MVEGEGHFMSSNNIILYSASDAGGQGRVSIVLNPRVDNALISYNPIPQADTCKNEHKTKKYQPYPIICTNITAK